MRPIVTPDFTITSVEHTEASKIVRYHLPDGLAAEHTDLGFSQSLGWYDEKNLHELMATVRRGTILPRNITIYRQEEVEPVTLAPREAKLTSEETVHTVMLLGSPKKLHLQLGRFTKILLTRPDVRKPPLLSAHAEHTYKVQELAVRLGKRSVAQVLPEVLGLATEISLTSEQ